MKRAGPTALKGRISHDARIELLAGILEVRDRERARRARGNARERSWGWALETKP